MIQTRFKTIKSRFVFAHQWYGRQAQTAVTDTLIEQLVSSVYWNQTSRRLQWRLRVRRHFNQTHLLSKKIS